MDDQRASLLLDLIAPPADLLSTLATADLEGPLTRDRAEQLLAVLTDGGGP